MPDPVFEWTDELTEFAVRNVKHATWAFVNPLDILRVIDHIQQNGGRISKEDYDGLSEKIKVGKSNYSEPLNHLKIVEKGEDPGLYILTQQPKLEDRPGFYTGQRIGEVIKDLGFDSSQAKHILAHNFILHAREALSFCSKLSPPGVPENFLKDKLEDHYVFNQKLNKVKCGHLIKLLEGFEVIKEGDCGLVVDYAPPILTFYQIASSYFFLSGGRVNCRVDAKDLLRQVDSIIPQRDEDYSVLGFDQHPVESWGRQTAWMSPESLTKMLEIGLVETETIARILLEIVLDETNSSRDRAKNASSRIKGAILEDIKGFKKPEPIGYEEVVSLLDQVNNS